MNARFSKSIVSVLVIAALALAIVPFAGAQEGPPQVGLRPDAPPYALHGPYWVGMIEGTIDADGERPLPFRVWYPALNPTGAEEYIEYPTDVQFFPVPEGGPSVTLGHALADAEPDLSGAPYPVVVYSPGFSGTREGAAWVAEHLASHGFVALSLTHPGEVWGEFWPSYVIRPLDNLRALDYMESLVNTDEALADMIDMERVGIAGWSSGGYDALAGAGARFNPAWMEQWCTQYPDLFDVVENCPGVLDHQQELLDLAGLDAKPDGLWPAWGDPRVDAAISQAGGGYEFGPEGLAAVTIPVMIQQGAGDAMNTPEWVGYFAYEHVSSAQKSLVAFADAGHMIFTGGCENNPWLIGNDPSLFWACADSVWDADRSVDLVNHFTTAFLLATLKDDAEAAAALAPDAVAFPGITYEAQGF
ncbi:MAG: hypothetical protein GX573_07235 [Chloroflexi bacterium]|nr:hypothetical protein [Chloroflexota bacterium]